MLNARLKRIDVGSLFKMAFVLYGVLGLIVGMFYAFIFAVMGSVGSFLEEEGIPHLGFLGGVLGIIAIPVLAVLYGVIGGVVAAICGALYNLVARWMGGIGFDFDVSEPGAAPPSTPVS